MRSGAMGGAVWTGEGTRSRCQGPVAGAVWTWNRRIGKETEEWKGNQWLDRLFTRGGGLPGLRKATVAGAVSTKRTVGDNVSDRGPRLWQARMWRFIS